MREATTILDFQHVTRTSGNVTAIHDISFQIHEGEIFGLIGPNGAGKSTIIKTIVGHLRPDSGAVEINHYNLASEFADAIDFVGAIVEYPTHYDYMTGWANLRLSARMYPEVTKERMKEVVELVGMQRYIHKKVSKYTLEMRQRLSMAQCILNYPQLLILDEPMNGLDPVGVRELCNMLKSLAKSGMSILIASHLMDETESLCDRVGILSHGYLLAVQDLHEYHAIAEKSLSVRTNDVFRTRDLLLETFENRIDIQIPKESEYLREREEAAENVQPSEAQPIPAEVSEGSDAAEAASSIEAEAVPADTVGQPSEAALPAVSGELILTASDVAAHQINRLLIEAGIEVEQICARKQTLEELYLKLTGGAVIE